MIIILIRELRIFIHDPTSVLKLCFHKLEVKLKFWLDSSPAKLFATYSKNTSKMKLARKCNKAVLTRQPKLHKLLSMSQRPNISPYWGMW